jgi:two-component system sensor histidine kinase/response regulator
VPHIVYFFRQLSEKVGGPRDQFPLTVRIFHSVLAISLAALFYNIPLNLIVGLPVIALASAVTLVLVAFLFYFSRYRNATGRARIIFCLTGTFLFLINFFLNSGIDGPTSYFFIMMLVIMVAIVPVNQYWYWVGSNVLLVYGLHLVQYLHPDWVPDSYPAKADRFIDINSAYTTVVVIILACFYIIRRRYDAERLEAQQNAARLLELDAEKNKLFSIISHDLRSPLSLVQNYLEILAEYDLSDTERKEIKTQLLQSTRGTLDMLNNVLHWSKAQMDGAKIEKRVLVLEELIKPQLVLFQAIASRKSIRLESSFASDATVFGNADMVQLISRNLLNNAIKFTAPGGHIAISATTDGQTCTLRVKDSGNGAPVSLPDNVFELSAASTRGTADETGVGLGLLLCREYVTLLGGRIWFNSDPESGIAFFVELPAKV